MDTQYIMEEECIICYEYIKTINNKNNIYFIQTCDCYYVVHQQCLINWIDKTPNCIYCNEPLYYKIKIQNRTKLQQRFKQQKKLFYNKSIFSCCYK